MRQEPNASRVGSCGSSVVIRRRRARRVPVRRRPDLLAVDGHGVLAARPGLEARRGPRGRSGGRGRRRSAPTTSGRTPPPPRGSGRGSGPTPWQRSRRHTAAVVQERGVRIRQARDSSTRHRRVAVRQPRRAAPLSGNRPPVYAVWLGLEALPQKPMPPMSSPPGHGRSSLLRLVGDDGLGGEEQRGDRRGVLQRRAGHLGRVDDAGGDQVDVLAGRGVEAPARRRGARPSPRRRRPRGRR